MRPVDKDKQVLLQKAIEKGESAKKALHYFDGWISKKKTNITNRMASSSNEEAVLSLWRELKMLEQLSKDLKTDIESGELAMDEMEEDI